MNITLTPELENLVNEQVRSGRYSCASEVVMQALELFRDKDDLRKLRIEELKREIEIGEKELREGKGIILTDEVFEELKNRMRARANNKKRELNGSDGR
ncbi:MAG TPA: type II toxin-antitoxin system ParD family antitoxin [Blastocatellia bacterium]|nr:type II toxin-antitoxin system ParD family antitoxin [Blastocatellia bacterium]